MTKTVVSIRLFDNSWIDITPNRLDCKEYQGSCNELEYFYGGQSIVYSISNDFLKRKSNGLEIEIHVRKHISRYFENQHTRDCGSVKINVDNLYNGIVKELGEREALFGYFEVPHERQPISRLVINNFKFCIL